MGEERDLLIEMRADMKHVREKVDHLTQSDTKQWEKMDNISVKLESHENTLSFLAKGFWAGVTGLATLAVAWIKGDR